MSTVAAYFDRGADAFVAVSGSVWDPIGEATVRVAGLTTGARVLDACCGAGASALPAARAVGPGGYVDAVDLAEALVVHGRRRAEAAQLDNVGFHAADISGLHRHGGEYDAMICVLGVFFLPEPAQSTATVLRSVRLGGQVTITTWAENAVQPLGRCLWDACAAIRPEKFADPPVSTPSTPFETPERLARFGECLGLHRSAVTVSPRRVELRGRQAWNLVTGTALAGCLVDMSEPEVDEVRSRFIDSWTAAGDHVDLGTLTLVGRVGAISRRDLLAFDRAAAMR